VTVTHQIAQLNVARMVAPLESPELAGFVSALEPLNAVADAAPGFVWRLQTEEGDATAIRPFDDDMILINMSVWESVEALREFVYKSSHRDVLRDRRQWFEQHTGDLYLVLWWVPVGTIPTMDEAKARLELLQGSGPTADAFTFRETFPPPAQPAPTGVAER